LLLRDHLVPKAKESHLFRTPRTSRRPVQEPHFEDSTTRLG
jgi:hypothetical protein